MACGSGARGYRGDLAADGTVEIGRAGCDRAKTENRKPEGRMYETPAAAAPKRGTEEVGKKAKLKTRVDPMRKSDRRSAFVN